jgi:acetylornithine/succinyldiaminopimelate/putrescine aminotransferase
MSSCMNLLTELRSFGGTPTTAGLDDATIERFIATDSTLVTAIEQAHSSHLSLRDEWAEALAGSEAELAELVQAGLLNFYAQETVNPYVALAASGPWVITTHGAVVHDNGGYGMLGAGHAPQAIMDAMSRPWVMANVMTPSISHKRFTDRLRSEIGQTRGGCPFVKFICMNSGSESVTVATRITDHNALTQAGPGGAHAGKSVKFLGLTGAFHGRTGRPAQVSDSCLPGYRAALRTFVNRDNLVTITPNDCAQLQAAFDAAEAEGVFFEAMFIEPVMGEGNPGEAITPEFYTLARTLTTQMGSMLLVDSIQAGIRGTGYLSIVDYPGFQDLEAPDLETYSKALNAGQYPMSVLALSPRAAGLYVRGTYGNTMTANPRALETACAVLDGLSQQTRDNIVARGGELVDKLRSLQAELPGVITEVRGTGLLLCAEIDPDFAPVVGWEGLENWCRKQGLGVIHGGKNALRFTPHFGISSAEVDLIVDVVRRALVARG